MKTVAQKMKVNEIILIEFFTSCVKRCNINSKQIVKSSLYGNSQNNSENLQRGMAKKPIG